MTLKQKLFVKEYIKNGGNGTQAVLKTYNTKDYKTASVISSENLDNPSIKSSIEEIANSQGVTSDSIIQSFNSIASKEVEKVSADSKIKATIELAKILGLYPGSKNTNLNVNLRGNLTDLGYSEAKQKLTELNSTITELTSDDGIEAST